MLKRGAALWVLMATLATLPAFARDFRSWRTDGVHLPGSSIGQQSSEQAFNPYESLFDAGALDLALYWKGALQSEGGLYNPAQPLNAAAPNQFWGRTPPITTLRDNREQDAEVDWETWPVRAQKTPPPPRPLFTPNVPQAWSAVELDLDPTQRSNPDHVLVSVSFEPIRPDVAAGPNPTTRAQVLNLHYPRLARGLPGNDPDNADRPTGDIRGVVRPFWIRGNDTSRPGLRIQDLEPLAATNSPLSPGVGVVTHPPILSRVPAVYWEASDTQIIAETLPVVYLVVGTGENGDAARVICLALSKPNKGTREEIGDAAYEIERNRWIPDPTDADPPATIEPPDPRFFNPEGATGGAVMWSYEVKGRDGSPTPVAGVSFADVGTGNTSQPVLFVTTGDGQVIALNAKAADVRSETQDGDNAINPSNPTPRWTWTVPRITVRDVPEDPGFTYGMAPAVARVSLNQAFSGQGQSAKTVDNARNNHDVSDWMLFVADTQGTFWGLDAPGEPQPGGGWDPKGADDSDHVRWKEQPAPNTFRADSNGNRERFIVPPVVYQGNTPMLTSRGAPINGSPDVGFDDEVIFAAEKGSVYALDAMGTLTVGGADDGEPKGTTTFRWQWPLDDTNLDPTFNHNGPEPRLWPRELRDPRDPADPATTGRLGEPIDPRTAAQYGRYFMRSPLAVALGAGSNPDGANPNLDPGDDTVYVPYLHTQPDVVPAGGWTRLYEYIGSMKPYGFIQASRPIVDIIEAEADVVTEAGATVRADIPLDRLRIGTVKGNAIPSNLVQQMQNQAGADVGVNPNYDPAGLTPEDTIYFVDTTWWDPTHGYVTLRFGTPVELAYNAPRAVDDLTPERQQETLVFPSAYRDTSTDPSRITPRRTRASLSEAYNRLELRRTGPDRPGPGRRVGQFKLLDEDPAQVRAGQFLNARGEGTRQPAMFAAGGAGAGGTLLAPSFFRGRIMAFDHRLRLNRVLPGFYHPMLENPSGPPPQEGPGLPQFGEESGDPGVFVDQDGDPDTNDPYVEDIRESFDISRPGAPDVGGTVVLVDGWVYIVYRNGHIRSLANVSGGGSGAGGGTGAQPPIWDNIPNDTGTTGTSVHAPLWIRVLEGRPPTDLANWDPNSGQYRDQQGLDASTLLEWGEVLYTVVYYGNGPIVQPQELEQNELNNSDPGNMQPRIDAQIFQREVQGQIRSSTGAVQQLPGANRGVRPTQSGTGHVFAIVPIFAGMPSGTNPLTPGTPLLWEKDATVNAQAFQGELTYDIQVTQPGVQWVWPRYDPNQTRAQRTHYWEVEPATGGTRFPTTSGQVGGVPRWQWDTNPAAGFQGRGNPRAPLVSYNNPIALSYDPDGNPNGGVAGMWNKGTALSAVALEDRYTNRLAPGRKNGDVYEEPYEDGARSGAGRPVVPTVGVAIPQNGEAQQVLFGEHGKSTPVSTPVLPNLAKVGVVDRSHLALNGRSLQLRVQPATLTKMGAGADFGTRGNTALGNPNPLGPAGSFDQNFRYWDDGPHGMYASIPESRIAVNKEGTSLNLASNPVQVTGRDPDTGRVPTELQRHDQLVVQVDVPRFAADDLYSTRWRFAGANGVDPTDPRANYNPLYPSSLNRNGTGRSYWDRAEHFAKPTGQISSVAGNVPVAGEDEMSPYVPGAPAYPGTGPVTATLASPNYYDDRLRRVVIFNDANNNGQLDLAPNFREAYRTFAVEVMVKPDLKLEAQQQAIDFGSLWHGKKGKGYGEDHTAALNIREWQWMEEALASSNPTLQSLARFYRQYWRPFNLLNTGNVNLAYIKPELIYQLGGGVRYIGLPAEGNDPWRALSLINPVDIASLTSPMEIFLRTSFDDQLLPDKSTFYGGPGRGVWLQKAVMGAANPGSVAYADPQQQPTGAPTARDPSVTGRPRDTWVALNIPTANPLGIYSGNIRFFNDRAVVFGETPGTGAGFTYAAPAAAGKLDTRDGTLNRGNDGASTEPTTEPPLRVKVRVMENMVLGRQPEANVGGAFSQDRRLAPAAALDFDGGTLRGLMVGYPSDFGRRPTDFNLYLTRMPYIASRFLFRFDELPLDWRPWENPVNNQIGALQMTSVPAGSRVGKPSMLPVAGGGALMGWTERGGAAGSSTNRLLYQGVPGTGGALQVPQDPRVPRDGVQLVQPSGTPFWMMFYSLGSGTRQALGYTVTDDLAQPSRWLPESTIATSRSLTTVRDPHVATTELLQRRPNPLTAPQDAPPFIQQESATLPQMAWISYAGTSQARGLTDVYMGRYRTAALTQQGVRNTGNLLGRGQDFGQVGYPRVESHVSTQGGQPTPRGGETLRANTTRTTYSSQWVDWLVRPYSPAQIYLSRPDVPSTQRGGVLNPIPLLNSGELAQVGTNQELQSQLATNLRASVALQNQRVLIDPAAGVVRFTSDTRTLARILWEGLRLTGPRMEPRSPDPIITAEFTPATLRVTRGDISASDPVVVPVVTQDERDPVVDASWYRAQIDSSGSPTNPPTSKASRGIAVAGRADRLWVFWRRSAGAVSGGAAAYYKVLRPGVRVGAGALLGVTADRFQVRVAGNGVFPEEVNPQNGQLYFPHSYEGQQVEVTYRLPASPQTPITEYHTVTWLDESGEQPIPMETSINEGSLNAFASYEAGQMTLLGQTAAPFMRKLDRMWAFWSSTRHGGDVMFATLAPRIGPEVNVNGLSVFTSASAAALSRISPNAARERLDAVAAFERRFPFTLPARKPGPPAINTRSVGSSPGSGGGGRLSGR